MKHFLSLAAGFAALGLTAVVTQPAVGQAPVQKEILLNVSQGQIPGDTGLDNKTVMESQVTVLK